MFRVGILCGQDEEKNTIRHAVELLSVRENFGCLIQDLSLSRLRPAAICPVFCWHMKTELPLLRMPKSYGKKSPRFLLYISRTGLRTYLQL